MGGAAGLAGVGGEAGRDGGRQYLERLSPNVDACASTDDGCSQKRGASGLVSAFDLLRRHKSHEK